MNRIIIADPDIFAPLQDLSQSLLSETFDAKPLRSTYSGGQGWLHRSLGIIVYHTRSAHLGLGSASTPLCGRRAHMDEDIYGQMLPRDATEVQRRVFAGVFTNAFANSIAGLTSSTTF